MIDPLDLRTFPPVEPLSVVPEDWRQTFISKHTECPRSSYLYLKYNGGALTHPLAGGTLLHRAIERFIRNMLENDERIGNPETAKDILNDVLKESTDLNVSPDRFDSMRAMMFHLAEGLAIDPAKVVFLETPVEVEIDGRRITGTIDFGEADESTRTLFMRDWKSAYYNVARPGVEETDEEYVPTKEEWPGTFQLVLYAYAAATGSIDGAPFNFGHYETFRLRQDHPRQFWKNEETMAYREAMIDRDTLLDWRLYLEAEIAKLEQAFKDWRFPAIVGKHCDYCPSSAECPIPAPVRNYAGEIRTAEDARRAAVTRESHLRIASEMWTAIKGYAKATGQKVRYGRDLELYWKKVEAEKVKDKVAVPGSNKKIKGRDALRYGVQQLEELGIPLDWSEYHTNSVSTRLTKRTLTPQELAEERQQKRDDAQ